MSSLMGMLTTIQSYVWGPPTLLLLIGYRTLLYDQIERTADRKISICGKDYF